MNEHKFIRDDTSKAVLNTDRNALEQYKIERTSNKYIKRLKGMKNLVVICLN